MGYIIIIDNGYILGLAQVDGEGNCTAEDAAQIAGIINNRPVPAEGYTCRLRTDLTWELAALPEERL